MAPKRVLWVVDYDDTLLGSTWAIEIMEKMQDPNSDLHEFERFRVRHSAELSLLQDLVVEFLEVLLQSRLGELESKVVILSNGDITWVRLGEIKVSTHSMTLHSSGFDRCADH